MAKEMKGITYCGECIYYSKKKHRCTAGAFVETDPRRTFYDDCPLPEVAPVQRWIPVTERLPQAKGEVCKNVILLMDDGLITVGWLNESTNKGYYLDTVNDFINRVPLSRFTHWMPLPEPPADGGAEDA